MYHYSKLLNILSFRKSHSNLHLLKVFKNVTLIGWIKSITKLKNKTFLKLHDGRTDQCIQVLLDKTLPHDNIRRGSCIKVIGEIISSTGQLQNQELVATSYWLLSNHNTNYEDANSKLFSSKNTGLKPEIARKDLLHLRHRLDYNSAIGRIRSSTKKFIRDYMFDNGFLEVDTPCLTSIDCEGGGEAYRAVFDNIHDNINVPKLTVSAQLHLEALVLGYGQVYSFGPVFRANRSKTRFHLSEFLMLEIESVTIFTTQNLCDEIEKLIRSIIGKFINGTCREDLNFIQQSNLVDSNNEKRIDLLSRIYESPRFTRISFDDAVNILKTHGIIDKNLDNYVTDLNKVQEQHLVRLIGGGEFPVFITDFPACRKPFYCKLSNNNEVAMAVDLLLPSVGEVVGGSVREDSWETMKTQIQSAGLSEKEMQWYLDLRSNGGCPHGGFGLGFDRLVQFLTGVNNIQDIVTFPRSYNTCIL